MLLLSLGKLRQAGLSGSAAVSVSEWPSRDWNPRLLDCLCGALSSPPHHLLGPPSLPLSTEGQEHLGPALSPPPTPGAHGGSGWSASAQDKLPPDHPGRRPIRSKSIKQTRWRLLPCFSDLSPGAHAPGLAEVVGFKQTHLWADLRRGCGIRTPSREPRPRPLGASILDRLI